MKIRKPKVKKDWKVIVEWVLLNKENEVRYLKRHKMYAIRAVYRRMGYAYENDRWVPRRV